MTKMCELEPHFPFENGLFSASSGGLEPHFHFENAPFHMSQILNPNKKTAHY